MRLSLLLLALLAGGTLFAQNGKKDVVYLKNGSVIRGTIMMEDPGKLIKLKTSDRSLWVFKYDQIDSIKHQGSIDRPAKSATPITAGYYNLTETGVLAGNSNNSENAPFTLMNVSNWQFANGFATGIGVGVHFFNETYMPVVADFRYFLRKQGPLPFVSLQTGYSIPLGGEYTQQYYYDYSSSSARPGIWPGPTPTEQDVSARGGFLVNPSVGFQTQINGNLALTFSAGYCYLRHSYGKDEKYKMDVDYNRLSLKIGLQFK